MDKRGEYMAFIEIYGSGPFGTMELAREYSRLKKADWGTNLVSLGIEEQNGKFTPKFNVWD